MLALAGGLYVITIATVNRTSPHLDSVKKLWRVNSRTLGMFPDGAFDEHATAGHIIGAIEGDQLIGYLLFRISKGKAKITHLCVAEPVRGKGVAKLLLAKLVSNATHVSGISLKCRRDFAVSSLWPKLGFAALGECRGRASDGSTLTIWWKDFNKQTLFTQDVATAAIDVVIDTNILIDIQDKRQNDSQGLLADWLEGEIRLCITDEVLNDIDRQDVEGMRRQRRSEAEQFPRLSATPSEYDRAEGLIKPLFPNTKSVRDESDVRHLIRAVAAGAKVFVSRDEPVLDRADDVYKVCGLSVVRPAELIARVDELLREDEYQRGQVAGARQISRKRLSVIDDDSINAILLPNESKRQLETRLHQYLSDPHRYDCESVTDQDGTTLAIYVVDVQRDFERVPFFRVCAHRLAGTLSRTILMELIHNVVRHRKTGILIPDSCLEDIQRSACRDLGFLSGTNGWLKLAFSGVAAASELADRVEKCGLEDASIASLASVLRSPMAAEAMSNIEHHLWPVKIAEAELPTYIVPIRPDFAQELFDEHLARQALWDAHLDLALNPESVYYRSARSRIVSYPGRILWYVSDKGKLEGRKTIRACSRIAEICIDKPKALFRRFKRLGVYEWSHVLETAKRDLQNDVMAIRFHDTELLRPVSWNIFQEILLRHSIKTNIESPVRITTKAFEEIYALALNPPSVR